MTRLYPDDHRWADHSETCEFGPELHPTHPCGRRVIDGVTRCSYCGNLDGSTECGCWEPITEGDLDALYAEAWGIADPGGKL